MAGYYRRRKSRAARWCLRFAVICIPFFILTVFLHRGGSISTPQAFWLIAVGIGMLVLSLVLGVRATIDLWEKGYEGGRATVNGIVLSLLMIAPFVFLLAQAIDNPELNDISTDVLDPPPFLQTENIRDSGSPGYTDVEARTIVGSYPDIVGRRYNTPPERIYTSVDDILKRWRWAVVASQNLPETAVEQSADGEAVPGGEAQPVAGSGDEGANAESVENPDMLLQLRVYGPVMKLPYTMVIRIASQDESSLVDVRSASSWGPHDFGANANNIRQFLTELDTQLQGVAGE
jgi:hypothetical protein